MNEISHEQVIRILNQEHDISREVQEVLHSHLKNCSTCRQYVEQRREFDRNLRNAFIDHIPTTPIPITTLVTRMRAHTMTKRIINFSGAIATMFLLIGLIWFANLTLPTQTNISPGQIKLGLSSPVVQPSSELTTDIPADFS